MAAERLPELRWVQADVARMDSEQLARVVDGHAWIVNAIGITKPLIKDDSWTDLERATRVNVLFPIELARVAERCGARVLQIATDCTFSGAKGPYAESAPHDALDVYGKTKSLGEVPHPSVHHLRCSIIGPETRNGRFLVHWLLSQPQGARVTGYANHLWNGLTTLQFGQLCEAIICRQLSLPHLQHIVPGDVVTKAELLQILADAYLRSDIQVNPAQVGKAADRSLATESSELNAEIWAAAGHRSAPTIATMVRAMATWDYRLPVLSVVAC